MDYSCKQGNAGGTKAGRRCASDRPIRRRGGTLHVVCCMYVRRHGGTHTALYEYVTYGVGEFGLWDVDTQKGKVDI